MKINSLVSNFFLVWDLKKEKMKLIFIIVSSTTQDKLLRNKIAQAIVERIKRAHAKGEKYKVFIIIPLIPAFEGDLASKDASAARNVMHFQYITISRGGNSIMEKLREANIEPSDYIGWYSLRNWDKLVPPKKDSTTTTTTSNNSPKESPSLKPKSNADNLKDPLSPRTTPIPSQSTSDTSEKSIWDDDDREHYVSELVYIHDKILIVDDRIVLIGSGKKKRKKKKTTNSQMIYVFNLFLS